MRNIASILIRAVFLIVLIVAASYAWSLAKPTKSVRSCTKPIAYSVGYFDRRFGISYKEFLEALSEAESVWESNTDLFSHSPEESALIVNLIYDYRQEITETLSDITEEVEETESTYQLLYEEFKKLKSKYDTAEIAYDSVVNEFNKKNEEYKRLVDRWNSGPRTSKEEFKVLEEKRTELQRSLSELKVLEADINEQGRKINVLVERLNRLAKSLNLDVKKFNTIGALRGETYTGGLYVVSPTGERSIDIFEFSNREKLVRVLAHELGHALGLEHIGDPQAIMYYLNQGDAEKLTEADISALQALCGEEREMIESWPIS